jgi:hypothetical protein
VHGRCAREHVHATYRLAQSLVAHLLEFGAGQRLVGIGQLQLAGDRARGFRMIPGDHLDRDAGVLAFGDRFDRLLAGRIDQADEPEKHEPALHVGGGQRTVLGHGPLVREREHP